MEPWSKDDPSRFSRGSLADVSWLPAESSRFWPRAWPSQSPRCVDQTGRTATDAAVPDPDLLACRSWGSDPPYPALWPSFPRPPCLAQGFDLSVTCQSWSPDTLVAPNLPGSLLWKPFCQGPGKSLSLGPNLVGAQAPGEGAPEEWRPGLGILGPPAGSESSKTACRAVPVLVGDSES